jgi:hypothetical protein
VLRYYSKFPCIMAKNEINTGMNKDIPQDFFLYVTCNTEIFYFILKEAKRWKQLEQEVPRPRDTGTGSASPS